MTDSPNPWPDGTVVRFTEATKAKLGTLGDLVWPGSIADPEWHFHVRTVPDNNSGGCTAYLVEAGEAWHPSALEPIDRDVAFTRAVLSQGRAVLAALKEAERLRTEMKVAVELAGELWAADGRDPRTYSGPDLAAALRLIFPPLRSDIMHWEGENIVRVEAWLRAKDRYERDYPDVPLSERIANADAD